MVRMPFGGTSFVAWTGFLIIVYMIAPVLVSLNASNFVASPLPTLPDLSAERASLERALTGIERSNQEKVTLAEKQLDDANRRFNERLEALRGRIRSLEEESAIASDSEIKGNENRVRIAAAGGNVLAQDAQIRAARQRHEQLNAQIIDLRSSEKTLIDSRSQDQAIGQALRHLDLTRQMQRAQADDDRRRIDQFFEAYEKRHREALQSWIQVNTKSLETARAVSQRDVLLVRSFVFGAAGGVMLILSVVFLGWIDLPQKIQPVSALAITVISGFCGVIAASHFLSRQSAETSPGESFEVIWRASLAGVACDVIIVGLRALVNRMLRGKTIN